MTENLNLKWALERNEGSSITDKQFLAKVRRIKDPVKLLKVLIQLDDDLCGVGDPYYRDLYAQVIEQGRKICTTDKAKAGWLIVR